MGTSFANDLVESVTICNGSGNIGDATAIDFRGFRYGYIYMPSSTSVGTITWYSSEDLDGTYDVCHSGSGNITSTVAASRSVPIPTNLVGARFLKAVGDAAGTCKLSLQS